MGPPPNRIVDEKKEGKKEEAPLECKIEKFDRLLCNVVRHGEPMVCSCNPPELGSLLRFYVSKLRLEESELVYAYVYLQKLQRHAQHIKRIQRCTKHRLLMAALSVAHKVLNDNSYKTSSWVPTSKEATGEGAPSISVSQMVSTERILLKFLDWDVWVREKERKDVVETWLECLPRVMQRNSPRKERRPVRREQALLGAELLDATER